MSYVPWLLEVFPIFDVPYVLTSSLLNYVPSRLRALRILRAFVPYVSSCLTRICYLRAFFPYVPLRLTWLTHTTHLCFLRAFFKCLARVICAP